MSHMIEGDRAIFLKVKPWHPAGHVIDKPYDNIIDAVLDILPEEYSKEVPLLREADGSLTEIKDYRIIRRAGVTEIGAVGTGFELMQPVEVVAPWQAFLDSGMCVLDCMGVLRGGKQLFVTLKLIKAVGEVVKGDEIEGYLVLVCGFDGSLSYIALLTNVRAVCANTVRSAILGGKDSTAYFKIRHTKNMRAKVLDAAELIAKAMDSYEAGMETYKALAAKKMDAKQMIEYVQNVFIDDELKKKLAEEEKQPSSQLQAKVERVLDLLTEQEGYDLIPAIHGTAWQAYNAVTQYLTHEQGRTDETRLHNQWFGPAVTLNNRALELALN